MEEYGGELRDRAYIQQQQDDQHSQSGCQRAASETQKRDRFQSHKHGEHVQ